MTPAIADPSGDISALWGWPAWAIFAALALAILAICLFVDFTHPLAKPTSTNAAPAPVKQEQTPVRARTAAGPSLRVHLCMNGCGADLGRPGMVCYPACESVSRAAEQILRDQAGAS